MIFALVQHHKWSLEEIENLIPFEREIYITLLSQHLDKEEKELKKQRAKMKNR